MGDEIRTFKEKLLFYTTAFFILLGTFSMFAFLFLVPFVIEPAFTTIFMQFEEVPALCETYETEIFYGARNCSWSSCREGCTKDIYTCTQIRVNYRLNLYNYTDEFNFTEYHINLKEAERELPPVKRTDRYERALRDYEYDGIGENSVSSSSSLTNLDTRGIGGIGMGGGGGGGAGGGAGVGGGGGYGDGDGVGSSTSTMRSNRANEANNHNNEIPSKSTIVGNSNSGIGGMPITSTSTSTSTTTTTSSSTSSSSSTSPINNLNKLHEINTNNNRFKSDAAGGPSISSEHSNSISNSYYTPATNDVLGGRDAVIASIRNSISNNHKANNNINKNSYDNNNNNNNNYNNDNYNDIMTAMHSNMDQVNIEEIHLGGIGGSAPNGFLIEDPDIDVGVDMDDLSGIGTLINSERRPFDEISELNENLLGNNSIYFYVGARLFPNVKGCGYPPMLNCTIWLKRYTRIGVKFPCYYSKVDPSLVISDLDYWQNTLNLIYSMAIPIPSFIISVIYLTYAYFKIYNEDEETAPLDKNAEDMDVDEEGVVDESDGAALAENAAGSQVINMMDSTTGDSCIDIVIPNGGPGMTKSISQAGGLVTTPGGQQYLSQTTTSGDAQMTPNSEINSFGHQLKVQMADDLSRDSLDNGVLSTSNSVQGNLSKTMTTSISTPPGPTAAV